MVAFTESLDHIIKVFEDKAIREDAKLKALKDVNESLEFIISSPEFAAKAERFVTALVSCLRDQLPIKYIQEDSTQLLRKLILEVLHRLPCNDTTKPFSKQYAQFLFKIVEIENEENVLICLRILIDIHKTFRPATWTIDIDNFLTFVKKIYRDMCTNCARVFDSKSIMKVKDINDVSLDALLPTTFSALQIQTEHTLADGTKITYTLLPRGSQSLRVLAELPISVVLFYQLFKSQGQAHKDLEGFLPLAVNFLAIGPPHVTINSAADHELSANRAPVLQQFVAAQVKTVSFLAFIGRIFVEQAVVQSNNLVQGVMRLLRSGCPGWEAINNVQLRKELLVALRHLLITELKQKFVGCVHELLEPHMLTGSSWTANDSLRALALSTLGDLVHHVRAQLPLNTLTKAVKVFSRNVHDPTLSCSIQIMSCKLLLNLADPLAKVPDTLDTFLQMLEVFVRKFKYVSKEQLPNIFENCEQSALTDASTSGTNGSKLTEESNSKADGTEANGGAAADSNSAGADQSFASGDKTDSKEEVFRYGLPNPNEYYSVSDCRSLVKTLVCGVKTIAWGLSLSRPQNDSQQQQQQAIRTAIHSSNHLAIFRRLLIYGLPTLNIYSVVMEAPHNSLVRAPKDTSIRTKDEKEVLEHFAGAFQYISIQNFKEIFSSGNGIEYFVDCMADNYALTVIASSFLANQPTSTAFAQILLNYLMQHMEEMGNADNRGNLLVKLFKIMFGSVSILPAENEKVLLPHLHMLVTRCMSLALTAPQPCNYFLLLRALFRSIGAGSHDLLYKEFLPLLPSLLHGLNSLQGGQHRQWQKELFVELCLTVPVRLSSLLPYLPLLMDPIVSALHGSPSLISQGLRTLELCVDNLQPDFLFEHIAPVRASLMQALWRTLGSVSQEHVQTMTALRVLGKFGGSNRKTLLEPQKLCYHPTHDRNSRTLCVRLSYGGDGSITSEEPPAWITVDLGPSIEASLAILKQALTLLAQPSSLTQTLRQQQVHNSGSKSAISNMPSAQQLTMTISLLESVMVALLNCSDQDASQHQLESQFVSESYVDPTVRQSLESWNSSVDIVLCSNLVARKCVFDVVVGLFYGVTIKEYRERLLPLFTFVVQRITLLAVKQQIAPLDDTQSEYLDVSILTEAIAEVLAYHEQQDLLKPCVLAINLILETASSVLGGPEYVAQLTFVKSLAETFCELCYRPAWYSKFGGCVGIKTLLQKLPASGIISIVPICGQALLFVISSLLGEVSNGCLAMAGSCIEMLIDQLSAVIKQCKQSANCVDDVPPPPNSSNGDPLITNAMPTPDSLPDRGKDQQDLDTAEEALNTLCEELLHYIALPDENIRKQIFSLIRYLAKATERTPGVLLESIADDIEQILFPIDRPFSTLTIPCQIATCDAFAEIQSLSSNLVTLNMELPRHKQLVSDLTDILHLDESTLQLKVAAYKKATSTNFSQLKTSVIKALSACHSNSSEYQQTIFKVLFAVLISDVRILQDQAVLSMSQYMHMVTVDTTVVHESMRPLLLRLGDLKSLDFALVRQHCYLAKVFPATFNERFCDQLSVTLVKLCDRAATNQSVTMSPNGKQSISDEMEVVTLILDIFPQLPAAGDRFVENLIHPIVKAEVQLSVESGSWREPLLKFLAKFPEKTVSVFFQESSLKDLKMLTLFMWLLDHEDGQSFRDYLLSHCELVANVLSSAITKIAQQTVVPPNTWTPGEQLEWFGVRIAAVLVKNVVKSVKEMMPTTFSVGMLDLLKFVRERLWLDAAFQSRYANSVPHFSRWQVPKDIATCLLTWFRADTENISLVFDLLFAFTCHYWGSFKFIRTFMMDECREFSVKWKRMCFLKFIDIYNEDLIDTAVKARALQYLILPCVESCFELSDADKREFIGTDPCPEVNSEDNLVSLFVIKTLGSPKTQQIDTNINLNGYAAIEADRLRIVLSQLACLFVQYSAPHIHDTSSKKQGNRLRQFMLFAWPCLQTNQIMDSTSRYHGHLLIAHIIQQFAINRKIVLQVFQSLLKAHGPEARLVVSEALRILAPAVPNRMDDGHVQVSQLTCRIFLEDAHTPAQLNHILQVIIRQYKVFYPVRLHLMHYMLNAMQKLGLSSQTGIQENRRLAVDLAETIVKWEMQRMKELTTCSAEPNTDSANETKTTQEGPMEKSQCNTFVNALIRLSVHYADQHLTLQTQQNTGVPPGANVNSSMVQLAEALSKRCLQLLKVVMKPEFWGSIVDLKLSIIEKHLLSEGEAANSQLSQMCCAVDVLAFLIVVLPPEKVPGILTTLQLGICRCISLVHLKLLKCIQAMLTKANEALKFQNSSIDAYEPIVNSMVKIIVETFSNYEKSTTNSPNNTLMSNLLAALAMLRTLHDCNIGHHFDRYVTQFVKLLQKLTRDFMSCQPEHSQSCAEVLAMCLHLLSERLQPVTLLPDLRKQFTHSVLCVLIEKVVPDKAKANSGILKHIIKIISEWIMENLENTTANFLMKEKQSLLMKLQVCVEKRFSSDVDITSLYLDLVQFIYESDEYRNTELTAKLEASFLSALNNPNVEIRNKFFKIYENSIVRKPFDRLFYILCTQNWEAMGVHYWIKPCLQLLLKLCEGTAVETTDDLVLGDGPYFPTLVDVQFNMAPVKHEPMDTTESCPVPAVEDSAMNLTGELDLSTTNANNNTVSIVQNIDWSCKLRKIISKQSTMAAQLSQKKIYPLILESLVNIWHLNATVAENAWIELFSQTWSKVLTDQQRDTLSREMTPFMSSGQHLPQRNATEQVSAPASVLRAFLKAFSKCDPPIQLKPPLLAYLAKSHALWHDCLQSLERELITSDQFSRYTYRLPKATDFDESRFELPELLDALSDIYSALQEEDLDCWIWSHRAKFSQTGKAIRLSQLGNWDESASAFEQAMVKLQQDSAVDADHDLFGLRRLPEYKFWEQKWVRCCENMNQWESLMGYVEDKGIGNPFLALECHWRKPQWQKARDCVNQIENNCPRSFQLELNLYKGYMQAAFGTDSSNSVQSCMSNTLKEWRRLPRLVGLSHLPLLRIAHRVVELNEASQISQALRGVTTAQRPGTSVGQHDVRAIVKAWRNRLPVIWDEFRHWADIFVWRQHHYQSLISSQQPGQSAGTVSTEQAQVALVGVHATAQGLIQLAKVARKQNMYPVAYHCLNRLYVLPNLPVMDGWQKVRSHLKCCVHKATDPLLTPQKSDRVNELNEALAIIENTNIAYFQKEFTADLYSIRGNILSLLDRREEADRSFSAAAQLHDGLAKCWASWGSHLQKYAFNADTNDVIIDDAEQAILCFVQAARNTNQEVKARKFMASILWLLTLEKDGVGELHEMLKQHMHLLQHPTCINWLLWLPQLFHWLDSTNSCIIASLIAMIGKMFPQSVFHHVNVRLDDVNPDEYDELLKGVIFNDNGTVEISSTDKVVILKSILASIHKYSPVTLNASKLIARQIESLVLEQYWAEDLLIVMNASLQCCQAEARRKCSSIAVACIPDSLMQSICQVAALLSELCQESKDEHSAAYPHRTLMKELDERFANDFKPVLAKPLTPVVTGATGCSFDLLKALKLLTNWVKLLEAAVKQNTGPSMLPVSSCRFLSQFSSQVADIELPGEALMPKQVEFCLKISRFCPVMETVQRNGLPARKISILAHNGKRYYYCVQKLAKYNAHSAESKGLSEKWREDFFCGQINQLFRMSNHLLLKDSAVACRLLQLHVPPEVILGTNRVKMVAQCSSTVSLFEILNQFPLAANDLVSWYYEKIASVAIRIGQKTQLQQNVLNTVRSDIFKEVQDQLLRSTSLSDWMLDTFRDATDHFVFRKQACLHLSLILLFEHVFDLVQLTPQKLFIPRQSGFIYAEGLKFNLKSDEQVAPKSIPFRLSFCIPNALGPSLLSELAVCVMVAARGLFSQKDNLRQLIRPLIWSQLSDSDRNIDFKTKRILTDSRIDEIIGRLEEISQVGYDGSDDSIATKFIEKCLKVDNLSKCDPVVHAWF